MCRVRRESSTLKITCIEKQESSEPTTLEQSSRASAVCTASWRVFCASTFIAITLSSVRWRWFWSRGWRTSATSTASWRITCTSTFIAIAITCKRRLRGSPNNTWNLVVLRLLDDSPFDSFRAADLGMEWSLPPAYSPDATLGLDVV